jgi:DNA-binding MarR family transcriptional regulator
MPTKPDERRLQAWRALLLAHAALVRTLDRELDEGGGLPLAWYEVLLWLYRAPGRRMRMQALVDTLLFTPSGVTRLIDRMAQAGLVTREKCASDRRGTFAVLTEAGAARFREVGPLHLRGIQQHFGRHVSDEEAEVMAAALGRVVADIAPGHPLVEA